MADKKKEKGGLGKGLSAIFGDDVNRFLDDIQNNDSDVDVPGKKELELKISEIRTNPYQPRKQFDKDALNDLAQSIKEHGIFTPLLVRKSVGGYELIAGERRLRAAKLAGLSAVPVISVNFTDQEMMEISILENVQRENLNPLEEATAYESLIQQFGYTQEKLAQRVGKSREYCANMLRLLRLPSEVQGMVEKGQLSMGHARALLSLDKEEDMVDVAKEVVKQKMSVRDVEKYVKEKTGKVAPVKTKKEVEKDPVIKDLENRMESKFGTQVAISPKAITIHYSDIDDLNRILEMMGCLEESLEG